VWGHTAYIGVAPAALRRRFNGQVEEELREVELVNFCREGDARGPLGLGVSKYPLPGQLIISTETWRLAGDFLHA